jgi:hypothetical protein
MEGMLTLGRRRHVWKNGIVGINSNLREVIGMYRGENRCVQGCDREPRGKEVNYLALVISQWIIKKYNIWNYVDRTEMAQGRD